jgi:hypothetical protein
VNCPHPEFPKRKAGLAFLSAVLARLLPTTLTADETEFLAAFYIDRIKGEFNSFVPSSVIQRSDESVSVSYCVTQCHMHMCENIKSYELSQAARYIEDIKNHLIRCYRLL